MFIFYENDNYEVLRNKSTLKFTHIDMQKIWNLKAGSPCIISHSIANNFEFERSQLMMYIFGILLAAHFQSFLTKLVFIALLHNAH